MSDPSRAELLVAAALYVGLHMRGIDAFVRTLEMHATEIGRWPNDAPYAEALSRARALLGDGWQDIATAPKDGTVVEVYAPSACGAAAIIAISSYHVDAGWTICTVREATHWRRHAPPVGEG